MLECSILQHSKINCSTQTWQTYLLNFTYIAYVGAMRRSVTDNEPVHEISNNVVCATSNDSEPLLVA